MINFLFANILQTFKASIPKAGQKTTKRGLESSRSTLSLFLPLSFSLSLSLSLAKLNRVFSILPRRPVVSMPPGIEKFARFFILARNRRRGVRDRGPDEGEPG